jgi:hypothetical protein
MDYLPLTTWVIIFNGDVIILQHGIARWDLSLNLSCKAYSYKTFEHKFQKKNAK